MTDNKKEVVQQKIEQTDQQVKGKIKDIEKSAVGRAIPMEIRGLSLYDILYAVFTLIAYSDLAYYLFLNSGLTGASKLGTLTRKIMIYAFLIAGIVGDLVFFIIFVFNLHSVYKYLLVVKLAKMISCLLISFFSVSGTMNKLLSVFFGIISCFWDLINIYYLALYFERLDSDDYDNYGRPLAKPDAQEQQV